MTSRMSGADQAWGDGIDERHTPEQRDAADPTERPGKRRRIALACSNCRHRKSRVCWHLRYGPVDMRLSEA